MANAVEELLKRQFNTNPTSVERWICLGFLRSLRFYRTCRSRLCPPLPDGRLRQDFITPRYNVLYAAANSYWRLLDRSPASRDMEAPKHLILALLEDALEQGRTTEDDHRELLRELDGFFYGSAVVAPETIQGLYEPLKLWLDMRMATMALNASYADAQTRRLSMANLNETMCAYRKAASMEQTRVVKASAALEGRRVFFKRLSTGLPDLDRRLGGGWGRGEVALVASANGGGKTVLGCQEAVWSARHGHRVAYFSTEQTPIDLTYRMLANTAQVNLHHFTNRDELRQLDRLGMLELANLPPVFANDPSAALGLANFRSEVVPRVSFMDWAQGAAPVVQDAFEPAVDALSEDLGGLPDLIIFDWIGGAMDRGKDPSHLRHYYYDAVNFLVHYAKSHPNVAILVMAQIDKAKAEKANHIRMVHLAECKAMSDNVTTFVGISSRLERTTTEESGLRMEEPSGTQTLCVDKVRSGIRGSVVVHRQFEYQRFVSATRETHGNS